MTSPADPVVPLVGKVLHRPLPESEFTGGDMKKWRERDPGYPRTPAEKMRDNYALDPATESDAPVYGSGS